MNPNVWFPPPAFLLAQKNRENDSEDLNIDATNEKLKTGREKAITTIVYTITANDQLALIGRYNLILYCRKLHSFVSSINLLKSIRYERENFQLFHIFSLSLTPSYT